MTPKQRVKLSQRKALAINKEMCDILDKVSRCVIKQQRIENKLRRKIIDACIAKLWETIPWGDKSVNHDEFIETLQAITSELNSYVSREVMKTEEFALEESRRCKFFRAVNRCKILGRSYVTTGEFDDMFEPPAGL